MAKCCQSPMLAITAEGHPRLAAIRCRDRLCPLCAGRRSGEASKLAGKALKAMNSPRFLTLTVRSTPVPLADQLRVLIEAWKNFRRSKEWKEHVTGGIYAVQITRGKPGEGWHPHLHILIDGKFWDQRSLSLAWSKCNGGSPICDIRAVHDREATVNYVTRYITRPNDIASWEPGEIEEYARATRGLRFFQTFGTSHKATLDHRDPNDKPAPSRRVCSLRFIDTAARDGHEAPRTLIAALRLYKPSLGRLFSWSQTSDRIDENASPEALRAEIARCLRQLETLMNVLRPPPQPIPEHTPSERHEQPILFREWAR